MMTNDRYQADDVAFYQFEPRRIVRVTNSIFAKGIVTSIINISEKNGMDEEVEYTPHGYNKGLIPKTPRTAFYSIKFNRFFHELLTDLSVESTEFKCCLPSSYAEVELHAFLVSKWLEVCRDENLQSAHKLMLHAFEEARKLKVELELSKIKAAENPLPTQAGASANPSMNPIKIRGSITVGGPIDFSLVAAVNSTSSPQRDRGGCISDRNC